MEARKASGQRKETKALEEECDDVNRRVQQKQTDNMPDTEAGVYCMILTNNAKMHYALHKPKRDSGSCVHQ